MTDVTAETANKTAQADQTLKFSDRTAAPNGSLDGRYRQIGISAVAAAVRYQAYAPAPIRWQDYTGEAAA
jgi:hypothetical protein